MTLHPKCSGIQYNKIKRQFHEFPTHFNLFFNILAIQKMLQIILIEFFQEKQCKKLKWSGNWKKTETKACSVQHVQRPLNM